MGNEHKVFEGIYRLSRVISSQLGVIREENIQIFMECKIQHMRLDIIVKKGALRDAARVGQIPACAGLVAYREILMPILKKIKGKEENRIGFQCDRNLIYQTAMSHYKQKRHKQRSPKDQRLEKLVIVFSSQGEPEPAIDADGLRREFYSHFFEHAICNIFEGNKRRSLPRNDADIIESEAFILLGMAIVESILNGDCGFPYLHPAVYHYIFGNKNYDQHFCTDDIPDLDIKELVQQITNASDPESLINSIDTQLFDHIGWPRGQNITIKNKHALVQQFLKWNFISKRHEALDQLREGLKFRGFLDRMQNQPLVEPLFIYSEEYSITAKYLQAHLLPLVANLEAKNKKEETAKGFAKNAISSLDDNRAKKLYFFITNLNDPPVYEEVISVEFNRHYPERKLPCANVCISTLIIPLGNRSLEEFNSSFVTAVDTPSGYGRM